MKTNPMPTPTPRPMRSSLESLLLLDEEVDPDDEGEGAAVGVDPDGRLVVEGVGAHVPGWQSHRVCSTDVFIPAVLSNTW